MSHTNYKQWKTTKTTAELRLSVVIPTYNEELRILPTIGAIVWCICKLGVDWELIISDDGSTDKTIDLVTALGLANVSVIKAPRHTGKGHAVQRGMLAARGRYILFSDADNSTPIEEIKHLLPKLENEHYDIAIGSRPLRSAKAIKSPLVRHWVRHGLNWWVHRIFPLGFRDTQCGFKLFTREAAHCLCQAQTVMGFAFDVELLYLAAQMHYKVAEVPVGWVDAVESKFTIKEFPRFLSDLSKIVRNKARGRYTISQISNNL